MQIFSPDVMIDKFHKAMMSLPSYELEALHNQTFHSNRISELFADEHRSTIVSHLIDELREAPIEQIPEFWMFLFPYTGHISYDEEANTFNIDNMVTMEDSAD